jgi:hypothetical protein
MIDFTLSKLNLLVFVLAVTAIVLFFMNTVNSNLKTRQSYELVYKVGQELKTGIDNPSYCNVKYIDIPKRLKLNSGITSTYNINYILNIAVYDFPNNEDKKKLVLSVLDGQKKNLYAAYDLDFKGDIFFYEWEYDNEDGKYFFSKKNDDEKYIDFKPQIINSIDHKLIIAKKIIDGKSTIHVFACGNKNNIPGCSDYFAKINGNNFITHLISEEKIDCVCYSSPLARNYSQQTDVDAATHLISICQ